jgi:alkylhydroperoxidase family enzyme
MTWVRTSAGDPNLDLILASHSLNEASVVAHLQLYRTVMFGPSGLTRAEREAVAVCVSAANDCHY